MGSVLGVLVLGVAILRGPVMEGCLNWMCLLWGVCIRESVLGVSVLSKYTGFLLGGGFVLGGACTEGSILGCLYWRVVCSGGVCTVGSVLRGSVLRCL